MFMDLILYNFSINDSSRRIQFNLPSVYIKRVYSSYVLPLDRIEGCGCFIQYVVIYWFRYLFHVVLSIFHIKLDNLQLEYLFWVLKTYSP